MKSKKNREIVDVERRFQTVKMASRRKEIAEEEWRDQLEEQLREYHITFSQLRCGDV